MGESGLDYADKVNNKPRQVAIAVMVNRNCNGGGVTEVTVSGCITGCCVRVY